jgi:hypothetical protein
MKRCLECKYAEWDKTITGGLHPSGNGKCKYNYCVPVLPQSMYWCGGDPKTSGGFISRKKELDDHCVYFNIKDGK